MPTHDRQVIVGLLAGGGNAGVQENVSLLMERGAKIHQEGGHSPARYVNTTVSVDAAIQEDEGGLRELLRDLTPSSRVYIVGHGNWQTQKIGCWDAKQVAELLVRCGMPQVRTISLVACRAGRDKRVGMLQGLIRGSANSFASKFHARLREKYNIKTVVYARTERTNMIAEGPDVGRKLTTPDGEKVEANYQEWHTKKRFRWKGSSQVVEWVHYAAKEGAII